MRKTNLVILLMAFLSVAVQAQNNISVTSFKWLDKDITATLRDTQVKDQNGQICALIKVETTETGFTFDFGLMAPMKVVPQVGEIWVYVSPGVKHVMIRHPQFGSLDEEYNFPEQIIGGRTYRMKLTTFKVEVSVQEEPTQQYLLFQITPANAMLEVDGQLWEVDSDGTAMRYVNFGTYSYRVQAPNYQLETGIVTVDNPDDTEMVKVQLKSSFVKVTLQVDADAEIWVNNDKKGIRAWTGFLGRGHYKIECKQAGHETSMISKEITEEMNGQTIVLPKPIPIYGSLNVESTPNLASIFIDGKEVGKTPRSINELLVGQHEVKLTKDGYADHIETVIVEKGERKQLQAIMRMNKSIQDFNVDGISFKMIYVEGGTFRMGATSQDKEARDNEKPVHIVTLDSYYMGETEVTQALWMAVMGSEPKYAWRDDYGRGDNYPVYGVSWDDVQVFLRKLNQKTGRNFRLPTEAEWEFAAKGGVRSKGYVYAGSNDLDNVSGGRSAAMFTRTTSVKSKSPNELGLYDMSGNVCEWCQDWYDNEYYAVSQSVNPQGPSKGFEKVYRGGGNDYNPIGCRVTKRYGYAPFFHPSDIGLRLVLPTTNIVLDNEKTDDSEESQLSKKRMVQKPKGALTGKFSVSPTEQVYFSQGNLQYQASTNTWRFAEHQWDYVGGTNRYEGEHSGNVDGSSNNGISPTYSGWIDLFGWGTSGYNHGAICYQPWSTQEYVFENYYAYGSWSCSLGERSGQADWGYNAISNGGNQTGLWRTLTSLEWNYLIDKRETVSGIRYVLAKVNEVDGAILLPDDWRMDEYKLNTSTSDSDYSINTLSLTQWDVLEQYGAVFLPAAGYREGNDWTGGFGTYYSATASRVNEDVYNVDIVENRMGVGCCLLIEIPRYIGMSVRLVCPIE